MSRDMFRLVVICTLLFVLTDLILWFVIGILLLNKLA